MFYLLLRKCKMENIVKKKMRKKKGLWLFVVYFRLKKILE